MPEGDERGRRRRWPWVVAGVLLLSLGSTTVYAWQVGWLSRSYLAAIRGCGSAAWTSPEPVPPTRPLVALEPIAGADVVTPTDLAFHPTLDIGYVTGRAGEVHVLRDGRLSEPTLTLEVAIEHDQGLLGVAVDPQGRWLYLNLTDLDGTSHVVARPLDDEGGVGDDGRPVISVDQDSVHHNGGAVTFGPDGMLYITFGDGGVIGDRWDNGQRAETLLGGILRIDPTPEEPRPYRVPADNPWAAADRGAENVALGLRNPYRISFDPATGDLWVADVGHNCYEEVTGVGAADVAGANLGWNRYEGARTFVGGRPDRYVPPLLAYPHDGAWCAVIGGHVYRGDAFPELVGQYVFGDFCAGALVALDVDPSGSAILTHLGVEAPGLTGVAADDDGELYALSGAGVQRVVPAG